MLKLMAAWHIADTACCGGMWMIRQLSLERHC